MFDAVRTIRRELDGKVPLIGFAGSPWTCGTYMVEGGSSREFPTIKGLAKEAPEVLDQLMDIVAETTTEYLNAQIDAGAQAVQIFDTWGAALEPDDYRRFSLASMQKIVDGLTREKDGRRIPVILFTKGAGPLLADLAETGCDALGVDWTTDLADAREYVRRQGGAAGQSRSGHVARVTRGHPGGRRRRSPATATDRVTCSISVTASRRTSIPTTSPCSSTPSTN